MVQSESTFHNMVRNPHFTYFSPEIGIKILLNYFHTSLVMLVLRIWWFIKIKPCIGLYSLASQFTFT